MRIEADNMDRIDVSIIVPIYNGASYIEGCCTQLVKQTQNHTEIILVDDGSTDGSGDICDEMQRRITNCIVIHQKNQGVSCARNNGISHARGEYIGFVDVDDQYDTDMYEVLYRFAKANQLDMVSLEPSKALKSNIVYQDKTAIMEAFFSSRIRMSVCTKIFKRSVICKDMFPPQKRIHEDFFATYMCLRNANSVGIINANKYHYIHREGSSSRAYRFHEKYFDAIDISEIITIDANARYPDLTQLIEARKARTYLRITKIYYLRGAPKEFRDRILIIKRYLESLDRVIVKKYFSFNDRVRLFTYLNAFPFFKLCLRTIDKK